MGYLTSTLKPILFGTLRKASFKVAKEVSIRNEDDGSFEDRLFILEVDIRKEMSSSVDLLDLLTSCEQDDFLRKSKNCCNVKLLTDKSSPVSDTMKS